jgi:hypothetical protein
MLLVHHRGTRGQVGQVANDAGGIPGRTPPSGLACAFAEQAGLGDHGDHRIAHQHALFQRGNTQADRVVGRQEGRPVGNHVRPDFKSAQLVDQGFPPSGRLGCQQHPTVVAIQEGLQGRGRCVSARPDSQITRPARVVVDIARGGSTPLKGLVADSRHACQAVGQLASLYIECGGCKQRPFPVMPAQLVALLELAPEFLLGGFHGIQLDEAGCARQVVKQGIGPLEKQRQVVFNASGCDPLADITVYRASLRITLEAGTITLAEGTNRFLVERELACRQQVDPGFFLD